VKKILILASGAFLLLWASCSGGTRQVVTGGEGGNLKPAAAINATPVKGPAPLQVTFFSDGSADPDGFIVLYEWDFNYTGFLSQFHPMKTGPIASYTYTVPGTYNAALRVTDNLGATGIDWLPITVSASTNVLPTADAKAGTVSPVGPFSDGPLGAVLNQPVYFHGTGVDPDGGIVTFLWRFDDPATSPNDFSNLQNPIYAYQSTGTHKVVLTVTDDEGTTARDEIFVTVTSPGANQPPQVDAQISLDGIIWTDTPLTAPVGSLIFFRALPVLPGGIFDPEDGNNVRFRWVFGDGGEASAQNPVHSYTAAGAYTITLAVTDTLNSAGYDALSVNIYDTSTPVADAKASTDGIRYEDGNVTPIFGPAPLTVFFRGIGTDPRGLPLTYAWSFGDGATSSLQNPTHTYSSAGVYNATLIVTNTDGRSSSPDRVRILADSPPVAIIRVDRASGDEPLTVNFDGTSSYDPDGGSIALYEWDFDLQGGQFTVDATGPRVSNTYSISGTRSTFIAALRVTETPPAGATQGLVSDIATIIISVMGNQPPTAVIDMTPITPGAFVRTNPDTGLLETVCPIIGPCQVKFDASRSSDPDGRIVGFFWDFGDGSTDDTNSNIVFHIFQPAPGNRGIIYTVTLTVTDDGNKSDTEEVMVNIGNVTFRPPVFTSVTPDEVYIDLNAGNTVTVNFEADVSDPDGGPITSILWNFGDGQSQTQDTRSSSPPYTISHTYDYSPNLDRNNPNYLASNYTVTVTATDDDTRNNTTTISYNLVISPIVPIRTQAPVKAVVNGAYDFTIFEETGSPWHLLDSSRDGKVIVLEFCRLTLTGDIDREFLPQVCVNDDGIMTPIWDNRDSIFGSLAQDLAMAYVALEKDLTPAQVQNWHQNNPGFIHYTLLKDRDLQPTNNIPDAWDTYTEPPAGGNLDGSSAKEFSDCDTSINPPTPDYCPLNVILDRNHYVRWYYRQYFPLQQQGLLTSFTIPGFGTLTYEEVILHFLKRYVP